jgi:hypothetical protein
VNDFQNHAAHHPEDETNSDDQHSSTPASDQPVDNGEGDAQRLSPVPGYNMSPVRPQTPPAAREPIMPSVPRPSRPDVPLGKKPTPTEEIDMNRSPEEQAKMALERLRQKMTMVAEEYAEGKINRAQFHAIYQRYQEQREITERMINRDPQSGAWQNVVQPGLTGFLRKHFESQVESYSIYHIHLERPIIRTGALQLPQRQVLPVLRRLQNIVADDAGHTPRVAKRRLRDDRYVVLVPGRLTVSAVVFSLEPAISQLEMIRDMHDDFERANATVLREARIVPREMVFPHRALFET